MTANVFPLVTRDELPLAERVAANIRAEIARFGLQQADVAQALGISQQSVSLKIHGKRPLSLDEIEGFARLVGLSPEDLVRGTTNPRPVDPDGGDVRHQGLEPRTRWISATPGQDGAVLHVDFAQGEDGTPDAGDVDGVVVAGPWAARAAEAGCDWPAGAAAEC